MDTFGEQNCRLCLNVISDTHSEDIDDVTKGILKILLLKLYFDEKSKHRMCKVCSLTVMEAFKFKTMCFYTDKTITTYMKDKRAGTIDLKEVYVKEKRNEQAMDILEGDKICRLCMRPIIGEFKPLHEIEAGVIENYIPEVNFSIVENPILCTKCFDCVGSHGGFIKSCLEVEDKIKRICSVGDLDSSPKDPLLDAHVKTEVIEPTTEDSRWDEALALMELIVPKTEMEIKSEDKDRYSNNLEELERIPDSNPAPKRGAAKRKNNKPPKRQLPPNQSTTKNNTDTLTGTCDTCGIEKNKCNCTMEPKGATESHKFKCDVCDYTCKKKTNLTRHQLRHKNPSEVKMYKCSECDFQSKHKESLTRHELKHENLVEARKRKCTLCGCADDECHCEIPPQVYKCDSCTYQSVNKKNFARHQLVHKDPSQVRMFSCDACEYKTKYARTLVQHRLKHKSESEVPLYACHLCEFKSKYKDNVRLHLVQQHADPAKAQRYKCEVCGYVTNFNYKLKHHRLMKHSDLSQVRTYQCNMCPFKTMYKNTFSLHWLKHADPSQVEMQRCDTCDFVTKYKRSLQLHKLRHADPSQVEAYSCDLCTYTTVYKNNLKHHKFKHADPAEVQRFKCDSCGFATEFNYRLKEHKLKHASPSEVPLFKCELCRYRTKYKNNLKKHTARHDRAPKPKTFECATCGYKTACRVELKHHAEEHEVPQMYTPESEEQHKPARRCLDLKIYKCRLCRYKTKFKAELRRHLRRHTNFSKAVLFKCNLCRFRTRYKSKFRGHELKCGGVQKGGANKTKCKTKLARHVAGFRH